METRLLHPGVGTQDVLTAYVATIRSMRVLDPSGLLLETITQPIHQYLRSREDTVRYEFCKNEIGSETGNFVVVGA